MDLLDAENLKLKKVEIKPAFFDGRVHWTPDSPEECCI
jgi:hypothetical protein